MRQALEMALDWIQKQPEETPDSKYDVDTRYVVIREIEAALAQPEQDWIERERAVGYREGHQNALKQMAQPEQEPVAFIHGDDLDNLLDDRRVAFIQRTKSGHRKTALYTIPLQCKPLTEWRPIETAPKGDVLLYCNKHIPIYVGRQRYGNLGEPSQDKFAWRCSGSGRYANPTHWMPLPETPIEAAHGIKG